jgi:serpin B
MRGINECLFILVAAMFCESSESSTFDEISDAAKRFSEKLFFQVIQDSKNDKNVFISPWSIYSALSMTLATTGVHTNEEIAKGLSLPTMANNNEMELHHQLGQWQQQPVSSNDQVKISLANRIFVDKDFPLKSDFVELMNKEYSSSVGRVPFKVDAPEARKTINDWVEQQTNVKIKKMLNSNDVDNLTKLILLNAVYFKGQWRTIFNESNTKEAEFQCLNSDTKKTVQMMEVKSAFYYDKNDKLDAQLLWLPFSDDKTQMVVVLPNTADGLPALEKALQSEGNSLMDILGKSKPRRKAVIVRIPRLKLESRLSLKQMLSTSFGMTDVFSGKLSDFSPMTESKEPLAISDAIHKAMFEMNEEGAVAAASTSISIKWRMRTPPPTEFTVDRPFLTVIVHDTTTPLFMVRIVCA